MAGRHCPATRAMRLKRQYRRVLRSRTCSWPIAWRLMPVPMIWLKTRFTVRRFATDGRGTGFLRKVDIPGYGTGPYIVDIGAVELNVPKIVGVTIATTGTTSVSAPYDVPVGSGEQLRTVPVGQANQIIIHFSEDVTVVARQLDLGE